jgi:hypothetical protein
LTGSCKIVLVASTAQIITTGREALRRAWAESHGGQDPNEQALRTWTAQILFESRFGREGTMAGTNNPGAWNASADFKKAHANDPTYGEFYHRDSDAQGNPIKALFRIYPNQLAAARDWIRAWGDPDASDLYAYAARKYAAHYFTGTSGSDEDRINAYVKSITTARGEEDAALAKGLAPEDPALVEDPHPSLNKFVSGFQMYGGGPSANQGMSVGVAVGIGLGIVGLAGAAAWALTRRRR